MQELGPATEHEMVLAFLQAEVDSPRFGAAYVEGLRQLGVTRETLLDRADLANAQDNHRRLRLLAAIRGYRANALLFTGFPVGAAWRRVRLAPTDFPLLRYGNLGPGGGVIKLSRGTRRVVEAAANLDSIDTDANQHIRGVIEGLRAGRHYPALIAADSGEGSLILVEGYTRATAHAYVGTPAVDFYVATSPRIRAWVFY